MNTQETIQNLKNDYTSLTQTHKRLQTFWDAFALLPIPLESTSEALNQREDTIQKAHSLQKLLFTNISETFAILFELETHEKHGPPFPIH